MPYTYIKTALWLLLLIAATGCSMGKGDGWHFTRLPGAKALDIRRAVGLKKEKLAPPQVPTRLVSTWTDTVLHRQGEKSRRGFGGRLLFFNEEAEDSIRVEGQLVVYAYDDSGRAAHETHPTRRYIFPTEQFVRHESETKVGASYSVWLPWDAVGGEQKNISLIARFEPKAGPLVVGEQTKHLLPGVRQLASSQLASGKTTAPATKPIGEIQLTHFTQESKLQASMANATLAKNQRPQVTSIALGRKSWEQRLRTPQSRRLKKSTVQEQATVHRSSHTATEKNHQEESTVQEQARVLPGPTR